MDGMSATEFRNQIGTPSPSGGESKLGVYRGYLLKKPGSISGYLGLSGWQPRYCVADDESLSYYSRSDDKQPRGRFLLSEGLIVTSQGRLESEDGLFGLKIEYGGRTLHFASRSESDIDMWCSVLARKTVQARVLQDDALDSSPGQSIPDDYIGASESERPHSAGDDSDCSTSSDVLTDLAHAEPPSSEKEPLFGPSKLDGFDKAYDLYMRREACMNNDGWRLIELRSGMRVFERSSSEALGRVVADALHNVELKCQTLMSGSALHTFALFMDYSEARSSWDESLENAALLSIKDAHNDEILVNLKPLIRFGLCKGRTMRLNRYWCRGEDGSYMIYFTMASDMPALSNENGFVPVNLKIMYLSILPVAYASTAKEECILTLGISADVGGWTKHYRPLARAQLLQIVRSVEALKFFTFGELSTRLDEAIDDVNAGTNGIGFPFNSGIIGLMASEANESPEFDDQDPYMVTEFCRKSMKNSYCNDAFSDHDSNSNTVSIDGANEVDDTEAFGASATGYSANSCNLSIERSSAAPSAHEPKPENLNYEYAVPRVNCILPMSISKSGLSAWADSGVDTGYWNLRGPNYLVDRKKVPSQVAAMEILQLQWSFYDEPKRNIAMDPNELIQTQHVGRKDRPFLIVINFMVPTVGNWTMYLCKRRDVDYPVFNKMLDEFLTEDDAFRNSRFKIIPSVVEGSWMAKKCIGSTPAILGKKIDISYYKGENWMEICVDVGSSRVAGNLMNLVKTCAGSLVLDLAFLLESQRQSELPEILLCGARMFYPLMSPPDDLSPWAKSKEILEEARKIKPYKK